MARARYLADTSVFGRLTKAPVAAAFAPLAAEGAVGVCAPVVFELGYATRNSADYDVLTDRLKSFPPIAVTEADHRRVLDVQATRNSADYVALTDRLNAFPAVVVTEADHQRALEVQAALVARGQHRAISFVDALVAATAEACDLSILHYDADFELIAAVTGQPQIWIVARGTAD